ncbi:hypothetical protein M408DRAFT_30771 [Serendipita vermifera MAFF 305830]|uniref:Uncharacterized protein n=1 Tax=Serendipita vermifera MAFF 305830 TaxID=933852 RepID=A0A0C3AIS1_SERVB|nr:hypothetical protein M408DRAFT_30771 [Serendipita vermifera MAFF 305830]
MTTSALWRTIAYGLARQYPTVRNHLIATLEADEALLTTVSIEKLFRKLIHEPLVAFEETGGQDTVVVVIDALDECGGFDGQHSSQRTNLMRTLKIWSTLPNRFKLVVTSRAEPDIVHLFSAVEHESFEILSGKMVQSKSSEDIEKFLEYHLGQIAARSNGALAPDWPGGQIKTWLVRLAAGLFIWVDTAVRFLRRGEPQEQLNSILGGASMGGLSALYSSILGASFVEPTQKVLDSFRRIVGGIILAKEPLTASSLSHLCSADHSLLSHIQNGLQSVMDSGEALRFSHQSFVDFLLNSAECRPGFLINLQQQKRYMTLGCFRIMKRHLRFNICDIRSSHKRNDDIVGLERRIKERIPPHLAYSSHYWASHLAVDFDPETLQHIDYFIQNQFLFWLENGNQEDKLARDMKKFIAAFGSAISQSVPHIYLSALPFSPRVTEVSKQYLKDYPQMIKIERGGQDNWPAIEKIIVGHTDTVNSVVFSPDGRRVASGSQDKTIRVWDAETAEMVAKPFEGHTDGIICVAFSPDGTRIASAGSFDMTIRVWDAETGEMVAGPFEGHTASVVSVAFSPDGTRLVSGAHDTVIWVWDARTAEMVVGPFEGHVLGVTSVSFSPDGRRVVSGSLDARIWLWDAETAEKVIGPFRGHLHGVSCVAFSPDGTRIASAGFRDKIIRVWDVRTAEMVSGSFEGHTAGISSVAFAPDGIRVVSGSDDNTIRVWDTEAEKMVAGPFEGHGRWVGSVEFSPDGTRIGSNILGSFEGHMLGVTSVSFSFDGKHVISGGLDGTIRLWNAEGAEMVAEPFETHTRRVSSVAFSPNGTRVASGSFDGTIRVWDAETAELVAGPFEGHRSLVHSVAFSLDGRRIASGSCDDTIRVWDAETSEMVAGPFKGHTKDVNAVAFSPDGIHIVSGSDDRTIRVWDAETTKMVVGPFEGHTAYVKSVAFSPDGTRIVSGSCDRTIRVWDAKTAEMVAGPFEGHTSYVNSVAFSPDGRSIASGSDDATIRVWDAKTARMVAGPFEGHINAVSSVAFSPDGSCIISGSDDGTIRIWDPETRKMVAGPFEVHTSGISSLAFSLDGRRIVTGSYDKAIQVRNVTRGEVVSRPFEGSGTSFVALSPNAPPIMSSPEDGNSHMWRTTASDFQLNSSFFHGYLEISGWMDARS